jgi:ribosomal protein S18 acetylase RimI-like enzyme
MSALSLTHRRLTTEHARVPQIRPYRRDDWDEFLRLDMETVAASAQSSTPEQRAALERRWPTVIRERFAWDDDRGPTTGNAVLLVLDADDSAYAGHLWLSEHEDLFTGAIALWVTTIAIAAPYRGRGWARILLDRALDEGRHRGLAAVRLGVDEGNQAARRLYEKMGFYTVRLSMERSLR